MVIELKLDVVTAGPRSQVRPTLITSTAAVGPEGVKRNIRGFLCLVTRGMNLVNVEYRVSSVALAPAALKIAGAHALDLPALQRIWIRHDEAGSGWPLGGRSTDLTIEMMSGDHAPSTMVIEGAFA